MQNSIEVVTPDAEGYATLERAVEQSLPQSGGGGARAFYNQVALAYNDVAIGSYLNLGRPKQALCNLRKVLRGRGLRASEDCVLSRMVCDAEGRNIPQKHRAIILKKLSNTQMRVLP